MTQKNTQLNKHKQLKTINTSNHDLVLLLWRSVRKWHGPFRGTRYTKPLLTTNTFQTCNIIVSVSSWISM